MVKRGKFYFFSSFNKNKTACKLSFVAYELHQAPGFPLKSHNKIKTTNRMIKSAKNDQQKTENQRQDLSAKCKPRYHNQAEY